VNTIPPVLRPSPIPGLFVTGTDTGVGKSLLAAAICAGLTARGERVGAFKPVVTGLDEPDPVWPADHELLAGAASAGQRAEDVAPYRFGPPASPHLAAELAGATIEPPRLRAAAAQAARGADVLVCEGVGGLAVPLTAGYLVRDLARDLALPVVVAARPGLGTINHTLLTVEGAHAAGLIVAGVVLTPWPRRPTTLQRSNRATIERLAGTQVSGLAPLRPPIGATAAATLPLATWI
jgi:dethiobiotin synthetase